MPETSRETLNEFQSQLQRILKSAPFRDAPVSRRLLEYLAENSLQSQSDRLKEYTIGVEILGRKQDFDPKIDTIVRVQVHRLRQKIRQYYLTNGQHDDVLLTIPKGRYWIEFTRIERAEVNSPSPSELASISHEDHASLLLPATSVPFASPMQEVPFVSSPPRSAYGQVTLSRWMFSTVLALVGLLGIGLGCWLFRNFATRNTMSSVERFWSAAMEGDTAPIVGYSDAIFLTDRYSNLFQFRGGAVSSRGEVVDPHLVAKYTLNSEILTNAGPLYYEDSYTGTGELKGSVLLAGLLQRLNLHPEVLRSQDITTDHLRTHNLILLGGPAQNAAVQQYVVPGDFEYQYRGEAWGATILNKHPAPGEAREYQIERDPANQRVRSTYGMISCQPTVSPSRRLIVLGGLDTTGTLGAAEYATSKNGSEILERAFKQSPYFQIIVHTTIKNGSSIYKNELAAIHTVRR